jgi:hypothetical protein
MCPKTDFLNLAIFSPHFSLIQVTVIFTDKYQLVCFHTDILLKDPNLSLT